MPVLTTASAISRISFSLTLQPNLFQLFQPIGGVLASPLSSERARAPDADAHMTSERHSSRQQQRNVMILSVLTPRRPPSSFNRARSERHFVGWTSERVSITRRARLSRTFSAPHVKGNDLEKFAKKLADV